MRMRKKKWADPYLEEHTDYALVNPAEYAGKCKELLGCTCLHVEIGMGKGDYLNNMASMYPEDGWIGIEKEHNVAAVACRKALEAENADIHNKRMIVGPAEEMLNWFAPQEIDVIHLNFSDPWPKKYTHKRRLSSTRFLQMYRTLLNTGGSIRMKTDNKNLFEDSVLYFLENGFTLKEFSVDYRRYDHPEDAVTEYESRFMELGQPIYQLCAVPEETDMVK
ncbi:MAG: tRNA (guanosine(46)-N7)-methyltransferase TrmB [Solobacterium sp.]|nr:tRNA (guanosine(46)-N7)-methyltransferase TrmB [Solobacterium sp.]